MEQPNAHAHARDRSGTGGGFVARQRAHAAGVRTARAEQRAKQLAAPFPDDETDVLSGKNPPEVQTRPRRDLSLRRAYAKCGGITTMRPAVACARMITTTIRQQ